MKRPLLDRILRRPDLARVIPRLQPELLHRVIQRAGLEDCGEIVALATRDQLSRIFDLDLWRPVVPGQDERFDADRFGVWIEVLADAGADVAARKLTEMDRDLAIAGFAQHVLVFDRAAISSTTAANGEDVTDVAGYQLVARRTHTPTSWDAIVTVLASLEERQPDRFHDVMQGCRALSNSLPEIDGLDDLLNDGDQVMFDLASGRERRRERQGHIAPAEARAFLQASRRLNLGPDGVPPGRNPIVRAYFRAMDEAAADHRKGLQIARDREETAAQTNARELAFLANAVMAGCPVQSRPFTPREASEAVAATCRLGRENWPAHWPATDEHSDFITAFQIGWTVLHDDVCMDAAGALIDVLRHVPIGDRDTRAGVDALRVLLTKHWRGGAPWRSHDAFDVLAILDIPAWAALLGLIAECPVMHAAIGARDARAHSVDPSAFEFISTNSQIASVREFMQALPEHLGDVGHR